MHTTFKMVWVALFSTLFVGCLARLQPELVTGMEIKINNGINRLCANRVAVPIAAVVTYQDGSVLETWVENQTSRHGKLSMKEFQWSSNLGRVDPQGLFYLPENRLSCFEQEMTISASIPSRPEISASKSILPDYGCQEVFDYSGQDASPGVSQTFDGLNGLNGQNSPHLLVSMGYLRSRTNRNLVLLKIEHADMGFPDYYVIDPSGQGVFLVAEGGKGGAGPDGSDGDDGSDGSSGSCSGDSDDGDNGGNGGHGEDGGNGGNGGQGGIVEIRYDQNHPELVGLVHYSVHGGSGGLAGRGGNGGEGGSGGSGCEGGSDGLDGSDGIDGSDGEDGLPGSTGRVIVVPHQASKLFSKEINDGAPILHTANQP